MKILKAPKPNMIVSIISDVTNSARLPLSVNNGNVSQRERLASSYSEKLKQQLRNISDGDECSVQQFREAFDNVLGGHKIGLKIEPQLKPGYHGSLGVDLDVNSSMAECNNLMIERVDSKIIGYVMYLPLNEDRTIIKNKYTALHESRHLFDHICNPKTINLRSCRFIYDDKKSDLFSEIHGGFAEDYAPLLQHSKFKDNIKQKLQSYTAEEAIDVLQASRNSIKTEMNAYRDELNFLKEKPLYNLDALINCWIFLKGMNYNKKLKFANELLADKIKSAREYLHNNLPKKD